MNPARYLLFPWWFAQIFSGGKAFCDNPIIGSPLLNRWGLHVTRVRAAAAAARRRRARLAPLLHDVDRAAFDRDGFVVRPDFLPLPAFEDLRDQILRYRGAARETVQGDTVTRRIALEGAALDANPAAAALLANPDWRGLIRYAWSYNVEPLCYVQSILSNACPGDPDPQTKLHADTFHPTVKAWLFLTDVAEDEGPLTYVPGSHRMTRARLEWERGRSIVARDGLDRLSSRGSFRIDRSELPQLGLPEPRSFAVPANTLVVADTSGFHARGPSVRPASRVEIWAYGRRNPFLPWTGLDPLGTGPIAQRRVEMLWRLRDGLAPWIGQSWRDVGNKTPLDPI
jgi:hypothetical protein